MSINDMLNNDEVGLFIMILLGVAVPLALCIAIPLGIKMRKKKDAEIFGDNETGLLQKEYNVKVATKVFIPDQTNPNFGINKIIFELSSGNRVDLAIRDANTYAMIVEGDYGTLQYQGKRFISFERNVN